MQPSTQETPITIGFRDPLRDQWDQEIFEEFATPPVKGQVTRMGCNSCYVVGKELKVCQRCKGARYCSKECQKKDWPVHKPLCIPCDRPNTFKLLKILISNATIMSFLQIAIVLDLDLAHDTKRELGFKFPFAAKVDVGIEPCDMDLLVKLVVTDEPVSDNIEGMLQIYSLRTWIPGSNIPAAELQKWRMGREEADRWGFGRDPVGIVHFFMNGVGPFTMVGRPIHSEVMDLVRSEMTRKDLEGGLSKVSCLDTINAHIRADKDNQLKLRTRMTESDKAIIRSARDPSVNAAGVIAFRERMEKMKFVVL